MSAHVSVYLMATYYLNVHSFLQISCCFKVLVRMQHNQVKKLYFKQCHPPWAGVEAMGMSTGHCPAALPPVTPSWKGLCPWYIFLVLGIGFVLYFILRFIHDTYKPHSARDYILFYWGFPGALETCISSNCSGNNSFLATWWIWTEAPVLTLPFPMPASLSASVPVNTGNSFYCP